MLCFWDSLTAYGDLENKVGSCIWGGQGIENGRELVGIKFHCLWNDLISLRPQKTPSTDNRHSIFPLRGFELTVHDSTNDLMNLALELRGESGSESRCEVGSDGLKGASCSSWLGKA